MNNPRELPLLVETDWLESHLNDSDLRILECTVLWISGSEGVHIKSAYPDWLEGHIPGSSFVDLTSELSEQNSEFPLMMPSERQFAEVMSQNGIGESNPVVLYDRAGAVWAARLWWMLRAFGFERAAILNGGWGKWIYEERPVSKKISNHPHSRFIAHFQPELIVSKDEVLAEIPHGNTCLINTLSPESYRKERIPGSINIPYSELFDPETTVFLDLNALRKLFEEHGATADTPIITYCKSGITACSDAFILTLLGQEQVAVYDGSMTEWLADTNLPVEKG